MQAFRSALRGAARPRLLTQTQAPALRTAASRGHEEESFEDFTTRYTEFFDECDELQELQRGLNNAFSYDLVPAATVIESAIKCARRLDHLPTATRAVEALLEKTENEAQYQQYLDVLAPLLNELGVPTREQLGYRYK